MLVERVGWSNRVQNLEFCRSFASCKEVRQEKNLPDRNNWQQRLLLAGGTGSLGCRVGRIKFLEEGVGPHNFSVQGARNQRVFFRSAGLGISDGYAIHFEGAPDGAFVIGFGFDEVG